MNKKRILPAVLAAVLMCTSCEKDPGEGGNSSITGYVHVTDYNSSMLIIQGEYDGADEDVYIIYGDDITYGDRIKSGPDGRFKFKYLREGKYTIYAYSDDTTLAGKKVVMMQTEIKSKKSTVDIGTLFIKKI